MKTYEIWTGNYSLGQGNHQGENPEKVGEYKAISFTVACMKHELNKRLDFIELQESRLLTHKGTPELNIINTGLKFDLNLETLSQSWIGKYYESESEALKSFN